MGRFTISAELRRELIDAGRRFAGESQAELLLHGYEAAGKEFFRRVEGKFAFALWDHPRRRLLIVNDRFGMKPLYFARLPGMLLAASEIKSLLAHADVSRAASRAGPVAILHLRPFAGQRHAVERSLGAPCGSLLDLRAAGRPADDRSLLPAWRRAPAPLASKADFLDRVDAAFARSVDRQTSQTRGLGISLSGGLDSRTILALVDPSAIAAQVDQLRSEGKPRPSLCAAAGRDEFLRASLLSARRGNARAITSSICGEWSI